MTNAEIYCFVNMAVESLLNQRAVRITRHASEPRDGFPLPIKRCAADKHGYVTQDYRPLAILEWANETLSGEIATRRARKSGKGEVAP